MVVVFGGAFNPPTVAHKEIYYHIQKSLDFSRFIYLPVSSLYTKSSLVSNVHRRKMLELMTEDMGKASVSDLEMEDSDFLGTYHSLLRIQEQYNDEVAFVIGADNLKNIHNWKHATSLLSEFKFIIINRNNINIKSYLESDKHLKDYKDNFIVLPNFDMNISSTMFRESFNPEYVPNVVFEYIMSQELY
ncbi:MAG: nicotinate (nicotinamide) nucleotide adenylyltransferase [Bacilli bacterium]|nr:nicotinate (nicotinamide) nucleotide adenylyltransferase [Bacilli bacterium]MBN2877385.1 nicotinate (nicotinamide) nucleotide adenylyltransferase [Bacilli bacterium]